MRPEIQTHLTHFPYVQTWLDWWKGCSLPRKLIPLFLVTLYWTIIFSLGGFRPDHFIGGMLFLAFYYGGPRTLPLFYFLLPFFLMSAAYDSQGFYAGQLRSEIHLKEPYLWEKKYFGIPTGDGVLLPAEWFQKHTYPVLDFLTGLIYINFIPVYLMVALYIRFRLGQTGHAHFSAEDIQKLSPAIMWSMLWLNVISCSTYYWYPAAPPWYVAQYGFGPVQLDVPPNPAGGSRFDALLGIHLYEGFYKRTPNIFGTIPSTHVAFPLLCTYFAFKFKTLRVFCLSYYLLMCFSALYLNHHYVIDLLWGSAYALIVGWGLDRFYTWRTAQNKT